MEGHLARFEELNAFVRSGRLNEVIQRDEARHVARIRRIAERIAAQAPVVRLALVAGPSSAGKTTTAIRICNWLEENGISHCRLSTDDYFVDQQFNPVDADGLPDWENVKAVDVRRLVRDVNALIAGEPVRLRKFDFAAHSGYDSAEPTRLRPGAVVVLEGIHALNPELTPGFDESAKFRIYLNLFTRLTENAGDAFFADDVRLLRRLVRDCAFRGSTAEEVLRRWPSVERGENLWINPFRRLADAVFNTALDYEIAVLKPFVADLISGVSSPDVLPWARRLARLLDAVDAAPPDEVPSISILRETIGGSSLVY